MTGIVSRSVWAVLLLGLVPSLAAAGERFDFGVARRLSLEHPDGSFAPELYLRRWVARDVDRDGRPDLVVSGGHFIETWLRRGSGYREAFHEEVLTYPYELVVEDLDGDGFVDFAGVLSSHAETLVRILWGRGDGTFGPESVVEVEGGAQRILAPGRDRRPYLLLVGPDVVVIRTLGRRVFEVGALGLEPVLPNAAIGDFDGNGFDDVALTAYREEEFLGLILLSDGRGGFLAPRELPPSYAWAGKLVATDFDLDGRLDLISAAAFGPVVRFGDGRGGFPRTRSFAKESLRDVGVGDLDLDGNRDFVLTIQRPGHDRWGDGTFGSEQRLGRLPRVEGLLVRDLDADGRLDIAATLRGRVATELAVFHGDGRGGFSGPEFELSTFGHGSIEAGDLDGDGVPELVAPVGGAIGVFERSANGMYVLAASLRPPHGAPRHPALADLDGDGRLDVLYAVASPGTLYVYPGLERGWPRTDPQRRIALAFDPHGTAHAVDLDGDDRAEVVVSDGVVPWLVSTGPRRVEPILRRPAIVTSEDFDGDGRQDLALRSRDFVVIATRDRPGGPLHQEHFRRSPGHEASGWGLLAGDYDGDGAVDLLAPEVGALRVLRNRSLDRLPTPWLGAVRRPAVVWNNLGHFRRFGRPTQPSRPAPSTVLDHVVGERPFTGNVFLQGMIVDATRPWGVAVTNGIELRVR